MSRSFGGGVYSFSLAQSETLSISGVWQQPVVPATDPVTYEPVDVTGYTAEMDIRYSDGTLLIDVGVDGTLTVGDTDGAFSATVAATDTATWPAGVYLYDLFLESPGGQRTRLLYGKVTVEARYSS